MTMHTVSSSHEPNHDQWLNLSLSIVPQPQPQPQSQPKPQPQPQPQPQLDLQPQPQSQPQLQLQPQSQPQLNLQPQPQPPPSSSRKRKLTSSKGKKKKGNKPKTIEPPFPWAKNTRAEIHQMSHLKENNINSISGKVKCKGCQEEYEIEFDLKDKFVEVSLYVANNSSKMKHRAPQNWTNPVLPRCNRCNQENALRPMFNKKRNINWLFLLLGQLIGCTTLSQLKYFCKHNNFHYTAAKDRLVYLAYLVLCKQIVPQGPFDPYTLD